MGAWLSKNFAWSGLTSRDGYRRWLPLVILSEVIQTWALWNWGDKGMLRFEGTAADVLLLLLVIPMWIGFILLSGRRFRSAGITRKWLLPLVMAINIPIGDYYLNAVVLWSWGVILVCALKPDLKSVAEIC
jgi:hypothetical protein